MVFLLMTPLVSIIRVQDVDPFGILPGAIEQIDLGGLVIVKYYAD